MSCCGSKRRAAGAVANAAPSAVPVAGPRAPAGPGVLAVAFVYDGLAALSVVGGVSGRRYLFAARGARVAVDERDAATLDAHPLLRRLYG